MKRAMSGLRAAPDPGWVQSTLLVEGSGATRTAVRAMKVPCITLLVNAQWTAEVSAQEHGNAIHTTFDHCISNPTIIEETRNMLLDHGWVSNEDAAPSALFSANIARDFNLDDLEYMFRNSHFMMASLLGNSGLGREQISMMSGEYQLAFLGIPEGKPYCVIAGPKEIVAEFEQSGAWLLTRIGFSIIEQGIMAYRENKIGVITSIDLEAFSHFWAETELPQEAINELQLMLKPATITIVATEQIQ